MKTITKINLSERFRGFLPVVVDVETGGFDYKNDALLEIGAVSISMNTNGYLEITDQLQINVQPFLGSNIEEASLKVNKIQPDDPNRAAIPESEALKKLFLFVREAVKNQYCKRAILVGHNANLDINFITEATKRCNIKRFPFHSFSVIDTVSLAALAVGETVLAKACEKMDIQFDTAKAHNALYDAQVTAQLFCKIVNHYQILI